MRTTNTVGTSLNKQFEQIKDMIDLPRFNLSIIDKFYGISRLDHGNTILTLIEDNHCIVLEITVSHWPFSNYIQHLADHYLF